MSRTFLTQVLTGVKGCRVSDAVLTELIDAEDAHLTELLQKIERATEDVKQEGQAAASRLEGVVETNERLLADLGSERVGERLDACRAVAAVRISSASARQALGGQECYG